MIKNSPVVPMFNLYTSDKLYSVLRTLNAVDKYLLSCKKTYESIPVLADMKNDQEQ